MNLDQALQYARDQGLSDRQIAVAVRAVADAARFERDSGLVKLTHPDLDDAEIQVHPDTREQYELAGWTTKAPKEK